MAHRIEREQAELDVESRQRNPEPTVLEQVAFFLGVEPSEELAGLLERQLREADRVSPTFVRTMRNTRRAAAASGLLVGLSFATAVRRLVERGEPVMGEDEPDA